MNSEHCSFVDVTEQDMADARGVLPLRHNPRSFSQRAERIRQEALFTKGDAVWLDYITNNPRHPGTAEFDLIGAAAELEETALMLRRLAFEMERARG